MDGAMHGVVIGEIDRFRIHARDVRPGDVVWRHGRYVESEAVRVTEDPQRFGRASWIVRGVCARLGTAYVLFPVLDELLDCVRAVRAGAPVADDARQASTAPHIRRSASQVRLARTAREATHRVAGGQMPPRWFR